MENKTDETELPQSSNASGQHQEDPPLAGNRLAVALHYNNLPDAGRAERTKSIILSMRNFNNWIKSMLINEFLGLVRDSQPYGHPLRVMDLCCGKGGDLLKFHKGHINHLICTDIAEVSIEHCKDRYEKLGTQDNRQRRHGDSQEPKFSVEFIVADATLVRLRERFADKTIKLNLVSCQFAFHYSFESLSQAKCMLRNASECLQAGGYFIASMPDANEIMRRLRESETGKSIGNQFYKIDFLSDVDPPPLFGAKYNFHLEEAVDCPEFLVHFETFVKLCRNYGLKLVKKRTFGEYYKDKYTNEQNLNLLLVSL